MYPTELKYTRDHEWLKEEGGEAVVGITDFAQAQLGDVVFVDLPTVGRVLTKGEVFGSIESVKAVSELYAPVAGEVTAVNAALGNEPELVNREPYQAWMLRIRPTGGPTDGLLDAEAYEALVK